MEYVILPVFFHTSTSSSLLNASVEFSLKDCRVVPDIPFFRIDCVLPYFEDGKEYSQIMVSGIPYYSTLTVDEVLHEIETQNEDYEAINNFNMLNKN